MSSIHPTALVAAGARLAADVEVGPHVIIDEHVSIGGGTQIMANAVITGYTAIGERNVIHMGAIIGHDPQDFSFDRSQVSYVEVGSGNVIREYCTIHRGTKPETVTSIGDGNFLMAGTHLAHNVRIGSRVVTANNVLFGGYVTVGDRAFIGGGAVVHQFCTIGRLAMVSGNGRFSQNIPPFVSALERNQVEGLNLVGLRRAGVGRDAIRELKEAYRILFRAGLLRKQAVEQLEASAFQSAEAQEFVAFVADSDRPLVQPRTKHRTDE